MVPYLIVEALQRVEVGINDMVCTALDLRDEVKSYCYGDIAMHPKMQSLQSAMATAFDLKLIERSPVPSVANCDAFEATYKLLRPGLHSGSIWPSEEWGMTPNVRAWPPPTPSAGESVCPASVDMSDVYGNRLF